MELKEDSQEGAKKNSEGSIEIGGLGEKRKSSAFRNALILLQTPLEVICLSACCVTVWGLLLMPIIYFHTEIVSNLASFITFLSGAQLHCHIIIVLAN